MTDDHRSFADVAEAVRGAIAEYTHALDDGRTDDVLAMFCPDGTFEIVGGGRFEGDALRESFASWVPRAPQRHLVTNTHVTHWTATVAKATSDVVLLVAGPKGWRIQVVGRYRDELRVIDGRWRFSSRTAEFVAPPSGADG